MWDVALIIVIVGAAAAFIGRRYWRGLKGSADPGCGCGCQDGVCPPQADTDSRLECHDKANS